MDITLFLAQIWGPVILAVAFGILLSRAYYTRLYRDLEQNALATLVFGMVAMAAGIVHVLTHNVWGTFTEGVVSFLGWGLLLKGTLFVIAPNLVDRSGDFWINKKLLPLSVVLSFVVGVYLCWFGYFA